MSEMGPDDSSYCSECGSCGEEGCCNPLKCISKNMETPLSGCLYGKSNLRDVSFGYTLGLDLYDDIMKNCKDEEIRARTMKIFDKWWDYYYKEKNNV